MNHSLQHAREIEALTFIYGAPGSLSLAARLRWSNFLQRLRVRLRKGTARAEASVSAMDGSFPGL